MKKKHKLLVGAVLVLTAGGLGAWRLSRTPDPVEPPGLGSFTEQSRSAAVYPDAPAGEKPQRVVYLDQGWSPAESIDFYTRPQGSRLIPYAWFLALEQPDSDRPLRDPKYLNRLGFLLQNPCVANPDGLPVGFVKDPAHKDETTDWFGFTCAACHTTELHYKGTAYRIDGGPAGGDFQTLLADLTKSLKATRDDVQKFERFAAKVLRGGATAREKGELRAQLAAACRAREEYDALNKTPHPYGPARLDAFGRIANTVLVTAIGVSDPDQGQPPDAPVSFPFLWDTPHHDYVQWNAVARNKVLGSDEVGALARNVGEVLGVFGEVRVRPPKTASVFTGYKSSARIPDLMHLEELVRTLKSPRWPAEFPPLDVAKVKAGEELYDRYCVRCHHLLDRDDAKRSVRAVKIPVKAVGTDPRMASNFADRRGKTGRLQGRRMFFVTGERFGREASADAILVHTVVAAILGSPWAQYDSVDFSQLRDRKQPTVADDDRLLVYKARPLNGVWATAPFLHNGSVPTIHDLLLPAEERPREFTVGRCEFDPVRVGYRTDPFPGGFRFNTTLPGNSNRGHEYGTGKPRSAGGDGLPALSEEQRWQLVEYLKSL